MYSLLPIKYRETEGIQVDGDIVLTTNNNTFIKGSNKHRTNVIMYEKQPTKMHRISISNFVQTDLRGFGTKVGSFSNTAVIIETMKALFTKPEQQEQREELQTRKKLLREIVGAEIDKIKGSAPPVLPSKWKKFEKIKPEDDDATRAEKYKHNSMVISKKPYFFRYLYPELNKKFKQFEKTYNDIAKYSFGIKMKKLLAKPDKSEEELRLVKRYHKFSPLINSNCTMNILCREFEDVDFNIQYDKGCKSMLPTFEDEFECKEETLLVVRNLYRKYCNKKASTYVSNYFAEESTNEDDEDAREFRFSIFDAIRDEINEEYAELNLSPKEGLFYIGQLSKQYAKFNWAFAWDLLGESILSCIERKTTLVPVEDGEGREYLGRKYVLKEFNFAEKEEEDGERPED